MKISSWLLCLGIMSSLHASIRNPFIMPLSPCDTTLQQLDGWRLQGVIVSSSRSLALMTDSQPQPQPLRVTYGSVLMEGVTVTAISRYSVSVSLTEICDGAHYHWCLPGGKNDKESHHRTAVHSAAHRQSKSSGHADSG